jgi:hypothetical protein
VGVNPPLHMLQNLIPGIHALRSLKKCKNPLPCYFHRCGKTVEITTQKGPTSALFSFWDDP